MTFNCEIYFLNLVAQGISVGGGSEQEISLTLLIEMVCPVFQQHLMWQTYQEVHDFLSKMVHGSRKTEKCVCTSVSEN